MKKTKVLATVILGLSGVSCFAPNILSERFPKSEEGKSCTYQVHADWGKHRHVIKKGIVKCEDSLCFCRGR